MAVGRGGCGGDGVGCYVRFLRGGGRPYDHSVVAGPSGLHDIWLGPGFRVLVTAGRRGTSTAMVMCLLATATFA